MYHARLRHFRTTPPACTVRQGDLGDSVQASTVQNIMGLIFVLTIFLGMVRGSVGRVQWQC